MNIACCVIGYSALVHKKGRSASEGTCVKVTRCNSPSLPEVIHKKVMLPNHSLCHWDAQSLMRWLSRDLLGGAQGEVFLQSSPAQFSSAPFQHCKVG